MRAARSVGGRGDSLAAAGELGEAEQILKAVNDKVGLGGAGELAEGDDVDGAVDAQRHRGTNHGWRHHVQLGNVGR